MYKKNVKKRREGIKAKEIREVVIRGEIMEEKGMVRDEEEEEERKNGGGATR